MARPLRIELMMHVITPHPEAMSDRRSSRLSLIASGSCHICHRQPPATRKYFCYCMLGTCQVWSWDITYLKSPILVKWAPPPLAVW